MLLVFDTEDQDQEYDKITDEGWNSQKQLSDSVEKKMKERKRRKKRPLYLHPKLSGSPIYRHVVKWPNRIFIQHHTPNSKFTAYREISHTLSTVLAATCNGRKWRVRRLHQR